MISIDIAVVVCGGRLVCGLCKRCDRLWVFVAHRAARARFLYKSVLNPAIILVEVALNFYVLFINGPAFRLSGNGCFPFSSDCCPASPPEPLFFLRFSPAGLN